VFDKKTYANGQKTYDFKDNVLTVYFKNGNVKATGKHIDGMMEGEWMFYREDGSLWQIGNLKSNEKHGRWVRYDKNNEIEYDELFDNGKKLKKSNYELQ
jgi:antitoxin component YwqK of YwqJK toxin-antitoxin module